MFWHWHMGQRLAGVDLEDEPVETHEEAKPGKPEPKGDGKKGDDDAAAIRKELETERARRTEAEKTAQYWAERAKQQPEKPKPAAKQEEDDDNPDAFLDDLAKIGSKGLAKRGFVRRSDLDKIIEERAAKIVEEKLKGTFTQLSSKATVVQSYPDMADSSSDLAKRAQVIMTDLLEKSPDMSDASAFEFSARLAAAEMGIGANDGRRQTSRRDRIDAQRAGSGRYVSDGDEDESDQMSENDLRVAKAFGLDAKALKSSKDDLVKNGGMRVRRSGR